MACQIFIVAGRGLGKRLGTPTPKFLSRYNQPENIRNSVSEFFSIFRRGFSKNPGNCSRESVVGGVMSIVGNPLVHNSPKALDGIEVRRVGRKEVQFHVPLRTFNPWLKYLGMMVGNVHCQV